MRQRIDMKTLPTILAFAAIALTSAAHSQFAAPPKELKQLDFLLGTFTGTAKTTMGDMKIKMTTTPAEGGMFLKTVSDFEVGPIKFTETMYTAWNDKDKKFHAWGFQSMVPMPRQESGELKGNVLTFISEPWEMMGTSYVSRSTMTLVKDGELTFVLEHKIGEEWSKQGEATLIRAKS